MQFAKRCKTTVSDEEKVVRLIRAPFMPMLSEDSGVPVIFCSFVNPLSHENVTPDSALRLGSRMTRVSRHIPPVHVAEETDAYSAGSDCGIDDSGGPDISVWEPDSERDPESWKAVLLDKMLSRVLRPHQVDGVRFIYKCLMGLGAPGEGCILADDMGLGKTLQSISVIWTLLTSNIKGLAGPSIRRALVLCPSSLVKNWAFEFDKWTKKRCKIVAVAESCRDKVIGQFSSFRYSSEAQVLISSYESFRIHSKLVRESPIDLVVCDEAHRLKNDKTKLSRCIARLTARKRLLVTGTPIQNELSEFFAMVALALPEMGVENFYKQFSVPINRGRDPGASDKEKVRADTALAELSALSSSFILRRTNDILAKTLPSKHLLILFCKLSDEQRKAYSLVTETVLLQKNMALTAMMQLVKVCCPVEPQGKMRVLASLLTNFKKMKDKSVVISSYTSCLDVVHSLCEKLRLKSVRLDGSVGVKERHRIVTQFNSPTNETLSVFLLSSKAGGCGINLIGANRLVMLDADWNPANDKQAMARVWREGQKKVCWIYRLFSTGTIEEKVLQRQINKNGLSSSVVADGHACALKEGLSPAEIRSLFELKPKDVVSDTHTVIQCKRCSPLHSRSPNEYVEGDILSWDHLGSADLQHAPALQQGGCISGSEKDITMAMYMMVDNF